MQNGMEIMSQPSQIQRCKLVIILIGLIELCLAGGLIYWGVRLDFSGTEVQKIEDGSELFAVVENEIMLLNYRTPLLMVTAQRSVPAARFMVTVTYADGRAPQQCSASSDLAGQLRHFSAISAQVSDQIAAKMSDQGHKVRRGEADFPIRLGILEVRDRITTDSISLMQFHAAADHTALALAMDGVFTEIRTPYEAIQHLEEGCARMQGT